MCLAHCRLPFCDNTHTIFHFRLLNRVHGKAQPNKCNFLVTQWSAANSSCGIGSAKTQRTTKCPLSGVKRTSITPDLATGFGALDLLGRRRERAVSLNSPHAMAAVRC